MGKLLTVVIATYNMEKYLDRCLSSLIIDNTELMSELEVLVINDGSKDKSSEIAHSYEKNYPSTFRVIDKENGNYGSCINRGLKESTGKYIRTLDADDWFLTENVLSYLKFLKDNDSDLFITNVRSVVNSSFGDSSYPLPCLMTFTLDKIGRNISDQLFMHSFTYRTDILKKLQYVQTEGISYTDTEWAFYPMFQVKTAIYYPEVIYCYDMSRDGQTMGASALVKNIWMADKVLAKMVSNFNSQLSNVVLTSKQYVYDRLYCYLRREYAFYLIEHAKELNQDSLVKLDLLICDNIPDLYKELDNEIFSRKFMPSFRYIKSWRRKHERSSLMFPLYDIYLRMVSSFLR